MKLLNKKNNKSKSLSFKKAGFTIIEFIVVVSIFSIFAGVILFRYSDFSGGLNLQNTAQEIALRIQQAQTFAISGEYPKLHTQTRGQAPIGSAWTPAYGVYFDKNQPDVFYFFFDRPLVGSTVGNGVFDDAAAGVISCGFGNSECIDIVTINTGEQIQAICATSASSCLVSNASILFKRPFPDATMFRDIRPGISTFEGESIKIQLVNKNNTRGKQVIVTSLGQIYIQEYTPI